MTDNNNKYITNIPKTYEVRYLENKPSGLTPAARSKVIKMYGSDYLSSRATINNPSYGPGIDSPEVSKYCSKCKANKEVSSGDKYCPTCTTSFGEVVKADDNIKERADKNLEVTRKEGGEYTYEKTSYPDGSVKESTSYKSKK